LKISGIVWLEEIVDKIARKHHVTQNEVREVLGRTDAGRYLIVFFVRKKTARLCRSRRAT
jgi:hypothetical protein